MRNQNKLAWILTALWMWDHISNRLRFIGNPLCHTTFCSMVINKMLNVLCPLMYLMYAFLTSALSQKWKPTTHQILQRKQDELQTLVNLEPALIFNRINIVKLTKELSYFKIPHSFTFSIDSKFKWPKRIQLSTNIIRVNFKIALCFTNTWADR